MARPPLVQDLALQVRIILFSKKNVLIMKIPSSLSLNITKIGGGNKVSSLNFRNTMVDNRLKNSSIGSSWSKRPSRLNTYRTSSFCFFHYFWNFEISTKPSLDNLDSQTEILLIYIVVVNLHYIMVIWKMWLSCLLYSINMLIFTLGQVNGKHHNTKIIY